MSQVLLSALLSLYSPLMSDDLDEFARRLGATLRKRPTPDVSPPLPARVIPLLPPEHPHGPTHPA
jgi:hypothetical protein